MKEAEVRRAGPAGEVIRGRPGRQSIENRAVLQGEIRSAIAMAYELARHEHVQNREWIALALQQLEEELLRTEGVLGGPRAGEVSAGGLEAPLDRLRAVTADAGPVVGAQIGALIGTVRAIQRRVDWTPARSLRPALGIALATAGAAAVLGALWRRRR